MGAKYFQEVDPKNMGEKMFQEYDQRIWVKIIFRNLTQTYGQGGPLNRTGGRGSEVQFEPADTGGRFGVASCLLPDLSAHVLNRQKHI